MQRIPYLEKHQKEMLKDLLNSGQQEFVVSKDGVDHSWLGAFADVIFADLGVPKTEYRVKSWVWAYLNRNANILDA